MRRTPKSAPHLRPGAMVTDGAPTRWRGPAMIITAGCMIVLITLGTRAGFGLWLAPVSRDLGWGREVFALAMAIQNLVWGVAQPFAGALADRYGAARVMAVGGVVYAVGMVLMTDASSPLLLHLSLGVLVGLGMAGASFTVVLAAFGRLVPEERRSVALGLGTAAGSLGQFLLVPLGQAFLDRYGWATALMLLAILPLLVVPLSGALAGRASSWTRIAPQTVGAAIREAGGHGGYRLLVAGFFVCGFHVGFIAVHLPAYLVDLGMAEKAGAWALAMIGLFNIAGSYLAGVLGGRYSKKYLLSGLYLTRGVVIAVFVILPPSLPSVLLFSAAIGFLWLSTVPLTSGLVAQIFGPRHMGMLFGFVFFGHQIGSFLAIWLGGYLFDATGSYTVIWWVAVALALAAALLHWPIDERAVARPSPAG